MRHDINVTNITSTRYMLSFCRNMWKADLSDLDTSQVTDMYGMFCASGLTSLDVGKLDTSNVTSMEYMFSECFRLTSLDVSKLKTSNVTNMRYMFFRSQKLTSLDVSKFDTGNVTDIDAMFADCTSLMLIGGKEVRSKKLKTRDRLPVPRYSEPICILLLFFKMLLTLT